MFTVGVVLQKEHIRGGLRKALRELHAALPQRAGCFMVRRTIAAPQSYGMAHCVATVACPPDDPSLDACCGPRVQLRALDAVEQCA